ncbi:ATP-binding cassette domain-containing protein [Staphylococcus epidermidis]|uniref:ATP-binding cassette domain-containing protein n=1 Tax=Staphylococcus TaxID=1279 RepID=UPI00094A76CF|nr:ABC transporter ATP-binding protein [Staphylococcus epidermidis]APT17792.1 hypothetical protein BUM85_13125 [Staphylococcus epidermidis]MDS3929996.1 ABC transporter ATP-binding protein [Staphylococcus epidermidis]
MLDINNIEFGYNKTKVLDDISCRFNYGDCIALIGANGSGKTTLIKLINGTITLKKGIVTLDEHKNNEEYFKMNTLYLPSDDLLPRFMSGREYLEFFHKLYNKNIDYFKLNSLLEKFDFINSVERIIEDYSTGMKKKIQIILAMLINPKLLIIDESLNGMDIEALELTKKMILDLYKENTIVLICSHDLSLLEEICNKFVLLKNGKIIKEGNVSDEPKSLLNTFYDSLNIN